MSDHAIFDPVTHDGGPSSLTMNGQSVTAGSVVSMIEDILERILDCMAQQRELDISFVCRKSGQRQPRPIRFPGRSIQEARKFARILLILQLSHDALVSGTILTKRHIFYQHQDLFESQRIVDDLVDDLAYTLKVERGDLNIVASAKALLAGPSSLQLDDGSWVDMSIGDGGTSLPMTRSIVQANYGAIRWILVIEKDAIFRSLTAARYWETCPHGPGLLITAKGYPDLMTLSFLQLVQSQRPQMPIFTLVDFDPDGLNIFRCFRFGSDSTDQATTPARSSIRLLGIKAQHVLELDRSSSALISVPGGSLPVDSQSSSASIASRTSISSLDCRDPISYLSCRDRKQALRILEKATAPAVHDDEAAQLRQELQVMLMMGIKAEIQWLDEAGNLGEWLDGKLGQMLSLLAPSQ